MRTSLFAIVMAAASAGLASLLSGCAAQRASAPVGPPPHYAAVISEASLEAQMRPIPIERPSARSASLGPGLAATEEILERTLRSYGYEVRKEPIPWPAPTSSAGWSNILAEIPGNDSPGEVILVCAHFDAVPGSPGADDNASGVAGVLELARRLSEPAFREQTGRTVRFALFNLEEIGLVGSRHHALGVSARSQSGEERVVAVINLEMIGFFSDEPNSQRSPIPPIPGVFTPPTVGDTIAIVANQASAGLARGLDASLREREPQLRTIVVDFIPGNGRAFPDVRRSDHAPFWDIGVPAVMVTDTSEFRNPHYHKATDTIETLDLSRMAMVVRGVEHAVRALAAPTTSSGAPRGPAS